LKSNVRLGIEKIGSTGRVVAVFNATGDVKKQAFTSEFEILRGDLARLCNEVVLRRPGIELIYGEYVSALSQPDDGSGPVHVEFTNGKAAEDYDLVIGADGFLSKTRVFASGRPAKEDVVDFGAYAAYFTMPTTPGDSPTHAKLYNAPGGISIMLRPSRVGTGTLLMAMRPGSAEMEAATAHDPAAQKALFARLFADAGWQTSRILEGIANADDFYYQQIAQVKTPRWTFGRVVLLGDAAYCPSALTGMGTSLAMYGAYTLAGEIAHAVRDGRSLTDALESYERVARPYVEEMQKIPPGVPRVALPETRLGVWILNTLAAVIYWLGVPRLVDLLLYNFGKKEEDTLQRYEWAEGSGVL
jgi:2-polyprenyl-6-methoxyphenol hydroxylase-like FAD-dependent oxidoreductase